MTQIETTQPSPHAGLGDELTKGIHAAKSWTGKAFLTFLLYLFFYLPGLVANILFLAESGKTMKVLGQAPPGRTFLWVLLWFFFFLPIIGFAIAMVAIAAGVLSLT